MTKRTFTVRAILALSLSILCLSANADKLDPGSRATLRAAKHGITIEGTTGRKKVIKKTRPIKNNVSEHSSRWRKGTPHQNLKKPEYPYAPDVEKQYWLR